MNNSRNKVTQIFKESEYSFGAYMEPVSNFLTFMTRIKEERERTPYNILIISDDADKSEDYSCRMLRAAAETKRIQKARQLTIDEIYEAGTSLHVLAKGCDCVILSRATAAHISNPSWSELADYFRNDSESSVVKIMCVNQEAADILQSQYADIYYRYFAAAQHIKLKEETEAEAYEKLLDKLELNDFYVNQEFKTGIHEYIETVHPKADLKGIYFVNDLYNRIVRSILINDSGSREVTADNIPFYHKAEEIVKINSAATSRQTDPRVQVPPRVNFPNAAENFPEECNVLFLIMSVLPGKLAVYQYQESLDEDSPKREKARFLGISQLEPGTKNILYKLALQSKKLDRIVLLESRAAREDTWNHGYKNEEQISNDTFWDDPEFMKDKYKSAVCFYKQRIKDYLCGKSGKAVLTDPENQNNKFEETSFPCKTIYNEDEIDNLFYDVPVGDDSEYGVFNPKVV